MSEDPSKPKEIRVTVDSEQMKQLIQQNDQLTKEKQALEAKNAESEEAKAFFEDMKAKLALDFENQGLQCPEVKTLDDLHASIEILKKVKAKESHTGNNQGSAPLENQYSTDKSEGYGTHEELIRDLRERSARGDPTAKEALRQLTFKALKGMREIHTDPYKPEQTETTSTDLIEDGKIVVKPDPMGIEHAFRRKKLIALAEKGDAQALAILNSGDY